MNILNLKYKLLELSMRRTQILPTFDFLKSWMNQPHEKIMQEQKRRLERLIRKVGQVVPYHRSNFQKIGVLDDFSLSHFEQIPFLTKKILYNHDEQLYSIDKDREEREEHAWKKAITLWHDQICGNTLGDPTLVFDAYEKQFSFTFLNHAHRWLENQSLLYISVINESEISNWIEVWNQKKPKQVVAPSRHLNSLLQHLESKPEQSIYLPERIVTFSRELGNPAQQQLSNYFSKNVYHRLVIEELGEEIGTECEYHNGLHVCPLTHYIEIIDHQGHVVEHGQEGEIVVTFLTNRSQPIVRYKTGVMGRWALEACACGRKEPRLLGSSVDRQGQIYTVDGHFIEGSDVSFVFSNQEWIQNFQLIQEDYDRVHIYVLPKNLDDKLDHREKEVRILQEYLKNMIGKSCEIQFFFTNFIAKFQSYVVSKVREYG